MPRGVFITLEGLDGSGKTTQIKRLGGMAHAPRPSACFAAPARRHRHRRPHSRAAARLPFALARCHDRDGPHVCRSLAGHRRGHSARPRSRAKSSSATASPIRQRPTRVAAASSALRSCSICTASSAADSSPISRSCCCPGSSRRWPARAAATTAWNPKPAATKIASKPSSDAFSPPRLGEIPRDRRSRARARRPH